MQKLRVKKILQQNMNFENSYLKMYFNCEKYTDLIWKEGEKEKKILIFIYVLEILSISLCILSDQYADLTHLLYILFYN